MSGGRGEAHDETEASQERWLVSYADFITLMFAFFAVLYATSQKDVEKTKEFQESIKRFLIKAGAFGESGAQINQGDRHSSTIESPIPTFRPEKTEPAQGLLDEAESLLDSKLSKAEREKYILDLTSDEWGVRVVLSSSAVFASQSERFREDALPFMTKLSGLLSTSKRKILVEGHVASGETGTFRSTWDFASARAVNMIRFIQMKEGIKPDLLAVASLADSRPLFQGERAAQNSRLEIVLLNQDREL